MGVNASKYVYALFAVLFVALAGCVNNSTSSSGGAAGIDIIRYDITPQEIYEDEGVDVYVAIENLGSKTTPDDSVLWIYGPSPDEWTATGEIADAFSLSGLDIPTKYMYPREQREIFGTLEYIGNVPQGVRKQYTVYARLCYPYYTSYATNLFVVSRDEARMEPKQGSQYETLSAGPIGIDFTRSSNTITGKAVRGSVSVSGSASVGGVSFRIEGGYDSDGNSVRYISLPIQIENRGSGFPTLPAVCGLGPNVPYEERGYVAVNVKLDGYDITSSCFPSEDTREISVRLEDGSTRATLFGIVKLRKEGNRFTVGRITCKLKDIDFDTPQRQYSLVVEAFYDYYIDRQRDVVVKSVEDIQ